MEHKENKVHSHEENHLEKEIEKRDYRILHLTKNFDEYEKYTV